MLVWLTWLAHTILPKCAHEIAHIRMNAPCMCERASVQMPGLHFIIPHAHTHAEKQYYFPFIFSSVCVCVCPISVQREK